MSQEKQTGMQRIEEALQNLRKLPLEERVARLEDELIKASMSSLTHSVVLKTIRQILLTNALATEAELDEMDTKNLRSLEEELEKEMKNVPGKTEGEPV